MGKDNYNLMDQKQKIENILLDSKYNCFGKYKQCEYCMTQYELLNLYIDGEITEQELRKLPSLNFDDIMENIKELKDLINMKLLKEALEENYFDEIIDVEKNEESSDGNVYMVKTKKEKYIVKLYNTYKHTMNIINIHSTLIKNKINVPNIIETKTNNKYFEIDKSNYIVVFSFIEGEQIGWSEKYKKLDNKTIKKMAEILKSIHNIKYNFLNDLEDVIFDSDDSDKKILLHFDLTRNNIFINNGEISIIDFDDAKKGNRNCDIAILIANLFFSKTYGVDIDGMNVFIEEYYKDELENVEDKKEEIKKYALKWIEYILDGNEFDTSTTESFEVKRKLIMENL